MVSTTRHVLKALPLLALVLPGLAVTARAQETPPAPPAMPSVEAPPTPPKPTDALEAAAATAEAPPSETKASALEKIRADQERARQLAQSTSSMQTGPVPHAYPLERYSILWERSPFEMEVTVKDDVVAESPFKDYALLGVMSVNGFQSASFFNKADNKSVFVSTEENSKKPFRLLSIEPGKDLASTVVRVSGSGQEGVIAYDPEVSKQRRAAGGGGGGSPGNPQALPQPANGGGGGNQREPATPNRPNRTAIAPNNNGGGNRGNQPRNSSTPATPGANNPGFPATNGQPTERRPRRRVIIPRTVPAQP